MSDVGVSLGGKKRNLFFSYGRGWGEADRL